MAASALVSDVEGCTNASDISVIGVPAACLGGSEGRACADSTEKYALVLASDSVTSEAVPGGISNQDVSAACLGSSKGFDDANIVDKFAVVPASDSLTTGVAPLPLEVSGESSSHEGCSHADPGKKFEETVVASLPDLPSPATLVSFEFPLV